MVSYKKLWQLVVEKDVKWETIKNDLNMSSQTIAKLNKNEYVSLQTLDKLAEYFNCQIGDLVERINKEP
jgi:DNA-binding Xre family transcriptional regulator